MDFTNISDLENCENNSFVDIIGIATDVGDVQNLTARFEHFYLSVEFEHARQIFCIILFLTATEVVVVVVVVEHVSKHLKLEDTEIGGGGGVRH